MEFYLDVLLPIFQKAEQIDTLLRKKYGKFLTDYTISEMHCLDYIGKIEKPNVTKLATALNFTKAGTSKMLKRLLLRKTVKTYTDSNNKKEVYYSLTASGKKIFAAHAILHKNWNSYTQQFLDTCPATQVKNTIKLLTNYSNYLQQLLENLQKDNNHASQS